MKTEQIRNQHDYTATERQHDYSVVVGNIGTVYLGADYDEARAAYDAYKREVKFAVGRASGEAVLLFEDGEPILSYWRGEKACSDEPSEPEADEISEMICAIDEDIKRASNDLDDAQRMGHVIRADAIRDHLDALDRARDALANDFIDRFGPL